MWFAELAEMLAGALGTDAVCEVCCGVTANKLLDILPRPRGIANAFAVGADRKQPRKRLYIRQRIFQFLVFSL